MPTYLIVGKTPTNPIFLDYVTAADIVAAEQAVLAEFASGIGVNRDGSRDVILLGLLELDATGSVTPNANPALVTSSVTDNYSWQTLSKQADSVVANSAVLVSDPDLAFQMAANTKYRIRGTVFYDTTAAGDYKYALSGPASPAGVRVQRIDAVAGATPVVHAIDVAVPAAQSLAGTGTTGGIVKLDATWWNGPNAGAWAFQFAQATQSNDSGAINRAGSWLEFAKA